MNTIEKVFLLLKNTDKSENYIEKQIGLAQGSFKNWRNEKSKPSADALLKIADYFNVTVDYLLGREQKEKPISEDMSFERFSSILKQKGLAKSDIENLSNDQLSAIAEIVKNFKK